MFDHSHQSDDENFSEENDSPEESRFLSWEEVQKRVEEKFAKYGLSREEVELIDEALESDETPDISPEKMQAYDEMIEDSNRELRQALGGLVESIRPKFELPKWQIGNVHAAWSGNLAKTLGFAYRQSLPKFFANPSVMGPGLLHGYLKDAGFFKNVFSDGIMPWRPEFPTPTVNAFSGFDFTKISAFVSQPEIAEQLDEVIDESDDLKDLAEENVNEIEQTANASRIVAKRIYVILIYVIYLSLHLYILTGMPFNQVAQVIITALTARGDVDDIRTLFKKGKSEEG